MKKTVCLIGRPNVGKSTMFNRLIKEHKSIIMDTPGVTRDRVYGDVVYGDTKFLLVDTGGIDLGAGDFNKDIRIQAEIAVEESDVIVFVVDGREDLTSNDLAIRDMLMKTNKKVIVALNKLDNVAMQQERIYYYYELGFEYVIATAHPENGSSKHSLEKLGMTTRVCFNRYGKYLRDCYIIKL